jgi:hypothetical protein
MRWAKHIACREMHTFWSENLREGHHLVNWENNIKMGHTEIMVSTVFIWLWIGSHSRSSLM